MTNYKRKLFLYSVLFAILLPTVQAANIYAQKIKSFGKTFHEIFGPLLAPDIITNIAGGNQPYLFWAKFLLWVLLFAIFFFLTQKYLFEDKKNIAVTISAVIALISVIAIPTKLLTMIFEMYGFAGALIMYGGPLVAIGFFAAAINFPNNRRAEYFIKAILFFIIAALVTAFNNAMLPLAGAAAAGGAGAAAAAGGGGAGAAGAAIANIAGAAGAGPSAQFYIYYAELGTWIELVAFLLGIIYVIRGIAAGTGGQQQQQAGPQRSAWQRITDAINRPAAQPQPGQPGRAAQPGQQGAGQPDPTLIRQITQFEQAIARFEQHHALRRSVLGRILNLNAAGAVIPPAIWNLLNNNADPGCARDAQVCNQLIGTIQGNAAYVNLPPNERGRFRRALNDWANAVGQATADDNDFTNRFAAVPAQGDPAGWDTTWNGGANGGGALPGAAAFN